MISVTDITKNIDQRGFFAELMRNSDSPIAQVNMSYSYPGIVRAWHRHNRGQWDLFIVLKGSLKIAAFNDETGKIESVVVSGERLQSVMVCGAYWHGFEVIGNESALLVYGVTKEYNAKNPDEERRPWNDPNIWKEVFNK